MLLGLVFCIHKLTYLRLRLAGSMNSQMLLGAKEQTTVTLMPVSALCLNLNQAVGALRHDLNDWYSYQISDRESLAFLAFFI